MARLGALLLWIGAVLGAFVGVGIGVAQLSAMSLHGANWWIAVGAVKLGLAASAGFMGAGAVVLRLEHRRERRLLEEGSARNADLPRR